MNPKPVPNNDLRDEVTVFSWDFGNDSIKLVVLSGNEYHYEYQDKSKKLAKQKISSTLATQLDEKFVATFIDVKYSGKYNEQKDCGHKSKMTMRGESFEFCSAKNKDEALDKLWAELHNVIKK